MEEAFFKELSLNLNRLIGFNAGDGRPAQSDGEGSLREGGKEREGEREKEAYCEGGKVCL